MGIGGESQMKQGGVGGKKDPKKQYGEREKEKLDPEEKDCYLADTEDWTKTGIKIGEKKKG